MTEDIGHTLPPDPTTCHPYYNGGPLPRGWAHIGDHLGYYIYAHYSSPDRPQWEHPAPPHGAQAHFLIDAQGHGRNFARDNFFPSSPSTIPPADALDLECEFAQAPSTTLPADVLDLECELSQVKASLEAATLRAETWKYQYDALYSTLEELKVYFMIRNNSKLYTRIYFYIIYI